MLKGKHFPLHHFIHNAANIWPLPLSYGICIITEVYTHLFAFQPCHKYLLCGKILLCKSYIGEHECTHMSGSDKKCYVCGLEIRYGREYHNCQAAPVMPEICGDSCRSLAVHSENCDINEFQLNILFYCVCFWCDGCCVWFWCVMFFLTLEHLIPLNYLCVRFGYDTWH